MKQKQNLLPLGKSLFKPIKGWYFFSLLFTLVIVMSCNNEGKERKAEGKTDSVQNVTKDSAGKGGPGPAAIGSFPIYRINKTDIDFHYQKLILGIILNDLADPKTISLDCYPMMLGGGAPGIPFHTINTGIDAAPFNTNNIMVCNNEIVLANYDWPNIDYLLVEPTRIGDNLGFNISAFKKAGGGGGVSVPIPDPANRESKPSPPAPPAFIPK